jgi:hypothetical protein
MSKEQGSKRDLKDISVMIVWMMKVSREGWSRSYDPESGIRSFQIGIN